MPSLTLTFSGNHATRIAYAIGAYHELGQPATAAQVKTHIIAELRRIVREVERREARAAIVVEPDVEVT